MGRWAWIQHTVATASGRQTCGPAADIERHDRLGGRSGSVQRTSCQRRQPGHPAGGSEIQFVDDTCEELARFWRLAAAQSGQQHRCGTVETGQDRISEPSISQFRAGTTCLPLSNCLAPTNPVLPKAFANCVWTDYWADFILRRAKGVDHQSLAYSIDNPTTAMNTHEEEAHMNIKGGPIFWFVLAIVVYLIYKAPTDVSRILGAAGHAFVAIGNGAQSFLEALLR